MQTLLKINTGGEENAVPTVEGCLKDSAGKFYSTQNAVRVHEWLRGTETAPLVLEAVKKEENGTTMLRTFGKRNVDLFPMRWQSGRLLKLDQIILASGAIKEVINRGIERTTEFASETADSLSPHAIALSDTTAKMMGIFNELWLFNANAMFAADYVPRRMHFETLETLDLLCTLVLTQRRRDVFSGTHEYEGDIPLQKYQQRELDIVISRIHQSIVEGIFHDPDEQAERDGLLDGNFVCQCMMAYSELTGTPILHAFMREPTDVYHWAKKVLLSLKEEIPSMEVRPKPQNVVKFPSK